MVTPVVVGLVLGWLFLLLATAGPASPASTLPSSKPRPPDLMATADNICWPAGEGGRIALTAFYQQWVMIGCIHNIKTYFSSSYGSADIARINCNYVRGFSVIEIMQGGADCLAAPAAAADSADSADSAKEIAPLSLLPS